jgi:hypothetical protein
VRRLQFGQPVEPSSLDQAADRTGGDRQMLGDLPIGPALATVLHDLLGDCEVRGMWTTVWPGGSVEQPGGAFGVEARQPLVRRTHTDPGCMGRLFHP